MVSAAPTILALETDSAWVVVLAVSLVTLPSALLLRRLIGRPGGFAAGLLLVLPLLLPIVAALAFQRAMLPEIAVLEPVGSTLANRPEHFVHVLLVSDGHTDRVTPYALSGSAGPWLLFIGLAVSSFMLLRRAVGTLLVRRLVTRCRPLERRGRELELAVCAERLARAAGVTRVPEVRILPHGIPGAFVVGARRGMILLSDELMDHLDEHELEAVIAHEVAHLEARDVPVVFGAGLLRDMVAWNPLAHLAFRRLLTDRELEADRRAAALTGRPLELASGLLRMCELVRGSKLSAARAGLGFLRPSGRVSRRISHLLALADGKIELSPSGRLPYVAAVALVAVLGLQAGARLAEQHSGGLAIVVGGTSASERGLWAPKHERAKALRRASAVSGDRVRSDRTNARPARYPDLLDAVVKEKHLSQWIDAVTRLAARLNISPTTLRWDARAVRIFDANSVGPVSILQLGPQLRL